MVLARVGVGLAFQYFVDNDWLAQEHGDETLEHLLVGLVAQDALDGPVEANVSAVFCHRGKSTKKNPNCQAFRKLF